MEGPLHAIKYPVFGLEWCLHKPSGKKIIAVAGGGGSSKSGLQNRVTFCTFEEKNAWTECCVIDSKSDLITNIALHPSGKFIAAGIENQTILYSLDEKCEKAEKLTSFQTDFAAENSFQVEKSYNFFYV